MAPPHLQPQASTASSSTTTLTSSTTIPITRTHGTLVLRADPAERRHIQWSEDVIDNEGMGKKSSKVCCIYHKPHAVDESSGDESSDSSDSDSDSEADDGGARPVGGNRNSRKKGHKHDHGDEKENGEGKGKGKATVRKRSPNAYEKQPRYNKKPSGEAN